MTFILAYIKGMISSIQKQISEDQLLSQKSYSMIWTPQLGSIFFY